MAASGFHGNLIEAGDRLYFPIHTLGGVELWMSDGTTAGTTSVMVLAGMDGFLVGEGPGGLLYFTAREEGEAEMSDGFANALWVTDGTGPGTRKLLDYPASRLRLQPITAGNGLFYFTLNNTLLPGQPSEYRLNALGNDVGSRPGGINLWVTAGTALGTRLSGQLPVPDWWNPTLKAIALGGKLLFAGSSLQTGAELFETDGTTMGTRLRKDIAPPSSEPAQLTRVGNRLFFTTGVGSQLWVSDGIAAGTRLVAQFEGGEWRGHLGGLTAVGNLLYFTVIASRFEHKSWITEVQLWVSDGSEMGTRLVKNFDPRVGFGMMAAGDGRLFFTISRPFHRREWWVSDGTEAGTRQLLESGGPFAEERSEEIKAVGSRVFFTGTTAEHGRELWVTDGTPEGTRLVKDILPGSESSSLAELTVANGLLYFFARESATAYALWSSDGTEAGTRIIKQLRDDYFWYSAPGVIPFNLTAAGSRLYFTPRQSDGTWLWVSDGTEVGTVPVSMISNALDPGFISPLLAFGDRVVFTRQHHESWSLWLSDGNVAGTRELHSFQQAAWSPTGLLTVANGQVFFRGYDPSHGSELWSSDGTPEGTALFAEINPGPGSSYIAWPVAIGNKLFFIATDGETGHELWTITIPDAPPGSGSGRVFGSSQPQDSLPSNTPTITSPSTGNDVASLLLALTSTTRVTVGTFKGAPEPTDRSVQETDLLRDLPPRQVGEELLTTRRESTTTIPSRDSISDRLFSFAEVVVMIDSLFEVITP